MAYCLSIVVVVELLPVIGTLESLMVERIWPQWNEFPPMRGFTMSIPIEKKLVL